MAKKIKLSELKVKSSVVELNQNQRKATKGGYVQISISKERIGKLGTSIADTQVDIRLHDKSGANDTEYQP